ncbi:hypothetical protein [Reyranella sp.]|uniref:hypothetical protein n=1 Tax=Reyranella sp. TaxID=1929291 RepID=UPI00272FB9A2|nr:hypothetical protein [Reyranella sp.]MDP2377795.1 hypothetical protein [Reyranella sp.]
MRAFRRLALLVLIAALAVSPALPVSAQTATTNVNSTAFPLASNIMFPARAQRVALKCQNATANDLATVTYDGFSVVIQPGGFLWEVGAANLPGRVPTGVITATGTAAQTLNCMESYIQ